MLELVEVGVTIDENLKKVIEDSLKEAERRALKSMNQLVEQFKRRSDSAKKQLVGISKLIIDDIELDEKVCFESDGLCHVCYQDDYRKGNFSKNEWLR